MTYNHYFYDSQGEIVEQLHDYHIQFQKGISILFSDDSPRVYMILAQLHVQGEIPKEGNYNWLVNRLTKLQVNMSYIDTGAPKPLSNIKSSQVLKNE